jgi:hypothetical protein
VVQGTAAVGFRHFVASLLVGLVASVAIAGSARADIVYDAGAAAAGLPTRVAVAHDDGSGAQTIVSTVAGTGAAQAPGVDEVIAPAVSPSGTTIVFEGRWDGAQQEGQKWNFNPAFCGIWCLGVLKYQAGAVTRVSNDPSGCPQGPCAVFEEQPEITASGQMVASYQAISEVYGCTPICGWHTGSTFVGVDHPPRQIDQTHGFFDPQPASDVPTACSGSNFNTPTSKPEYPSPSPDGSRLVYTNCEVSGTPNAVVVQNMDGSNANACAADDQPVTDPSFSLDGSRIVDAETGSSPGLWDYPSACPISDNSAFIYALAAPSGTTFQSPRYTSGGKILFVAIPSGQNGGDVWSIPATCGQNGTPCQFPAAATQVTHTSNDVLNVAWTSQTLVPTTTTGGSSGTGNPPTPPGGQSNPTNNPSTPANNTSTPTNSDTNNTTPVTPTTKPRCIVPKLQGKTLAAAKTALKRAHCKLGKANKRHASRKMRGKVVAQSPKPRSNRPPGSKVAVVVGK